MCCFREDYTLFLGTFTGFACVQDNDLDTTFGCVDSVQCSGLFAD